ERLDCAARRGDRGVRHRDGWARLVHGAATTGISAARAVLGGDPRRRPRGCDQRRASPRAAARGVLGRRGAEVSTMSTRRLLGVLGLLLALAVWEAWARSEPSFLFPSASTVLERAWHVWPTDAFLGTVAASLERLAAGFAI